MAGILGVSYIHTSIGMTLDRMSSVDDFHLLSVSHFLQASTLPGLAHAIEQRTDTMLESQWPNVLGLSGIVIAVLVPVFLRRSWRKKLAESEDSGLPAGRESNPSRRGRGIDGYDRVDDGSTREGMEMEERDLEGKEGTHVA